MQETFDAKRLVDELQRNQGKRELRNLEKKNYSFSCRFKRIYMRKWIETRNSKIESSTELTLWPSAVVFSSVIAACWH